MSIDGKYPNVSVTFKKPDRWMLAHIKRLAEERKWPIAFLLARLIEKGLKDEGIENEEKT